MSLTGGFNKIRRNYAASKAKTEFEKVKSKNICIYLANN